MSASGSNGMKDDYHIPVMLQESIESLNVQRDGLYVDCTLGGGGHSREILKRGGRVLGIDRDPDALAHTTDALKDFGDAFRPVQARFSGITDIVADQYGAVDGVLMDLGVSSRMLDDPARGFSYRFEGPLLMTMSHTGESAYDIVNTMSAVELASIFREFGEERNAKRIANNIVKRRTAKSIETTSELSDIIEQVSRKLPQKSKSRVFQALRIYINEELDELREGLDGALEVLKPGGRLVVLSYHSIEDRIVKHYFREKADPCICPPSFPQCACGRKPLISLLTRKAVKPSLEEIEYNPRARSALLRGCEKLPNPE